MVSLLRSSVRSLIIGGLALATTVALTACSAIVAAVALTATTALIVPGTGTKDPSLKLNYEQNAVDYYTSTTTTICQPTCGYAPVPYIAEFWPFPLPGWGGLAGAKWNVSVASGVTNLTSKLEGPYNPTPANQVVVFGFSQGATVSSRVKGTLADLTPAQKADIAFVLIGDPNRPNGGIFERLALLGTVPILDATFGQPAPTDIGIATTDIAFEYDGVADFPLYPINFLADLNALAGFAYIHSTYLAPKGSDAATRTPYGYTPAEVEAMMAAAAADCSAATHCEITGDTRYITVPAKTLPIMQPFLNLGKATGTSALIVPLVDLVSPVLRVLIETGYDRTLPYGTPAPARLFPLVNPITLTADLVNAVGEGVQAALADVVGPLTGGAGGAVCNPCGPSPVAARAASVRPTTSPAPGSSAPGLSRTAPASTRTAASPSARPVAVTPRASAAKPTPGKPHAAAARGRAAA